MSTFLIRYLKESEVFLLDTFLYHDIFQEEGIDPLSSDIIKSPHIKVYTDNFGEYSSDLCLVAELNKKIVGAVWTRIFSGEIKGYGYMDELTPELTISVLTNYPNRGVGKLLMRKMLVILKEQRYDRVSLSVSKNNYAVRMYQKLGFTIFEVRQQDLLMVIKLHKVI